MRWSFSAPGTVLLPLLGLKYMESSVLLRFFSFERLGLSVPMARLTSGFFNPLGRNAESSGCTLGFSGVTLGRCTHLENSTGLVGGFGPRPIGVIGLIGCLVIWHSEPP